MPRARTPKPRRVTADPPSPEGVLDVQDVFECVAYHLLNGPREELIPDLAAWSCCCKAIQYSNAVYIAAAARLGLDNAEKRASFMAKPMDRPAQGVFQKMAALYWQDKEGLVTANWLDSERSNDDKQAWKRIAHAAEHSSLQNPILRRLATAALGEMRATQMCNHTSWMRHLVTASMGPGVLEPNDTRMYIRYTANVCGPNCTVVMIGDGYRQVTDGDGAPVPSMPLDCFVANRFGLVDHNWSSDPNKFLEIVVNTSGYSGMHVDSNGDRTHSLLHMVFDQAARFLHPIASTNATLRMLLEHPLKQWRWSLKGDTILHALLARKFWRTYHRGKNLNTGARIWQMRSDVLGILLNTVPVGPGSLWTKKNNAGQTPRQLFEARYSEWHEQCTESNDDPRVLEPKLATMRQRIDDLLLAAQISSTPLSEGGKVEGPGN